ncbi:glycosyltransferase [Frateuria sp. YIM B11624]|uniref:glycosyltransferase n=1 Tax=Frateuria sp. YIM B11624 TaxID=3143185 RepID=UPI003C758698
MNDLSSPDQRRAILIVGMHRSGTSALTRVINLHGVPLGRQLLEAAFDNEAGFWENQAIVHLHERILDHLGSSWDDPRELPAGWLEEVEGAGFLDALVAAIREEFGDAPLWAVKDPRLCRFLPLWLKALESLRIEPRLVFAVRHPAEVVGSLVRRNGLSPAVASMLWLRHLAEPLRASRGSLRCVTDYAGLLADWRACMDSLARCLAVEWPARSAAVASQVEANLHPDLKHQHAAVAEELLPGPWRAGMLGIHAESLQVMAGERDWGTLEASIEAFLDRLAFALPLMSQLQVKSRFDRLEGELAVAQQAREVYRCEAERLFAESSASLEEASKAKQEANQAKQEAERIRKLALMHEEDACEYEERAARLHDDELREVEAARQEVARAKVLLVAARGELVKREARINTLELARQELELIKGSWSWRITRPIRVAKRLLRGGGRLGAADREQLLRLLGRAPAQASQGAGAVQVLPPLTPQAAGFRDIFVWSVIDWHFRIQRPQHLAKELAREGHRVFYVSCQFVNAGEAGFQVEPLDDAGRLFRIQFNLAGAPGIYHTVPTPDDHEQLRESLGTLLAWTRSRSCLSLVQHAWWLELAQQLPNMRLVYDCMDHHGGFDEISPDMLARESELMRTADLLVVTSQWLQEETRALNPRTLIVRNACEYDHFATPADPCFRDERGRKVIGYYGAIAEWFDVDLLEAVARRFPDCLVLMVGNDTVGAGKRLGHLDNVRFTGEVPYDRLPFFLTGFDVCLLPFQVIPLTLATNPVKVYEYLSAGKDVVAIDLPEMAQFHGLVRTASDHAGFIRQLAEALAAAPDAELVARRRQFASEQTWSHRVKDLVDAMAAVPEPRVSVIVVTYNNLDLTKACLRSLELYSDYCNLEVIVVDNASADDTPAFLTAWATQGEGRRVILNEDNRGFAAANNQGLAVADGDYLVMLNNDTHVTPGWIATLVAHLRRSGTLGMIGPVTNNIGNEARIDIRYDDMDGMLQAAGDYTARHVGQLTPLRTAAFFCVMMRREVYEKVGPLDEAFGIGFFEDDDYCRRVDQAGWSIACAEDVFVHHQLSASFNKLKQERRAQLFEQNKALYEKKWGPWEPHRYRPGVLG